MAYVRFIVRSHVDPIRLALLLYELAMLYTELETRITVILNRRITIRD